MLSSDLTLTLIIVINAVVLSQNLSAKEIIYKRHSRRFLGRSDYFRDRKESYKVEGGRIFKRNRTWNLEPINLMLANLIDNYEFKKEDMKALYSGAINCGLKECGIFNWLITEKQEFSHLKCLRKGFKKRISQLLRKFHKYVQRFLKCFQTLINFERNPYWRDQGREKILVILRNSINTLNIEIETEINIMPKPENLEYQHLLTPENETHLMVNEWRIIRQSERFFYEWRKNFHRMYKCWEERKRKERGKLRRLSNSLVV